MKARRAVLALLLPQRAAGAALSVAHALREATPGLASASSAIPSVAVPVAASSASDVVPTAGEAAAAPTMPQPGNLTLLPLEMGLPLVVRVGVYFADVREVDENDGTFTGTIDLRAGWRDPRLAYDASTAPSGFLEF